MQNFLLLELVVGCWLVACLLACLVGWLVGWLDFQTQAADRRAKRVSGGVLAAAQLAAKSMMEDGRGRWRWRQVSRHKKT